MQLFKSVVRGVGGYLPPKCVKNADLEENLATTDAWIVERTGMKQRYVIDDSQNTSDLASESAKIEFLSRPFVASSPLPILKCSPSFKSLAI